MHEEDAFLRAILENTEDDSLRLIYADWLEEHGDLRAEFLHVEVELARVSKKDPGRGKLKQRWKQLRRTFDPNWLALLDRTEVEGCFQTMRFDLICPQRWEKLTPTDDPTVRFCSNCNKRVFHCRTIEHAQRHAERGHCVAVDSGVPRREGDLNHLDPTSDLFLGMPVAPRPRLPAGLRVRLLTRRLSRWISKTWKRRER